MLAFPIRPARTATAVVEVHVWAPADYFCVRHMSHAEALRAAAMKGPARGSISDSEEKPLALHAEAQNIVRWALNRGFQPGNTIEAEGSPDAEPQRASMSLFDGSLVSSTKYDRWPSCRYCPSECRIRWRRPPPVRARYRSTTSAHSSS
jgi:hypothetical protein